LLPAYATSALQALIGAARRLFTDPRIGRQTRGDGAKGKGSPRRLALIANQLALTCDIQHVGGPVHENSSD